LKAASTSLSSRNASKLRPRPYRRDLAVLDREGVVHRVHGGAVASQSFQTAELTLDTRQRSASGAKAAIARAALDFLPQGGGSIFWTQAPPLTRSRSSLDSNTRRRSLILSPIACLLRCLLQAMACPTSSYLAVRSARLPKPSLAIPHCAPWL